MGAWCRTCGLQRGVQVERLNTLLLVASVERLQELRQLILAEACRRKVFDRCKVCHEARQQLLVPVTADLVEPEVEHAGLLQGHVEKDHRHSLVAEAPGGDEALVASDDGVVLASRQDRLHKAVLLHAPGQRLQLCIADLARVRWIGAQLVDRELLHGQHGRGCSGHLFSSHVSARR